MSILWCWSRSNMMPVRIYCTPPLEPIISQSISTHTNRSSASRRTVVLSAVVILSENQKTNECELVSKIENLPMRSSVQAKSKRKASAKWKSTKKSAKFPQKNLCYSWWGTQDHHTSTKPQGVAWPISEPRPGLNTETPSPINTQNQKVKHRHYPHLEQENRCDN